MIQWNPFCAATLHRSVPKCFHQAAVVGLGMPEDHKWASYQIRKIAGCACAGNAGNVYPRRWFRRKLLFSDPGMLSSSARGLISLSLVEDTWFNGILFARPPCTGQFRSASIKPQWLAWACLRIINGPLTRYAKLQVAHVPGMPGTFTPAADFEGNCFLAIPACITARALRTCRGACRDRLPAVTGKTFPAFPVHVHPQFCVSGKRSMA